MKIELRGLELYGYHGVHEHERERGQRFLYDVELEVGDRGRDDRIENAVDYGRIAATVREVTDGGYPATEALATAIAEAVMERFAPEHVKVRVRKPDVRPSGIEIEFAAVTAELPRNLGVDGPAHTRDDVGTDTSRLRFGQIEVEGARERPPRVGCGPWRPCPFGTREVVVAIAYVAPGQPGREAAIRQAAVMVGARRLSTIRETEPWGVADQPRSSTRSPSSRPRSTPRELLDRLLEVERELGRVRTASWGPRTIDLDLLVYGDEPIDEPGLTVPHPHLHERLFVLEPLAELAPNLLVPGRGEVAALLTRLQSPP